MESFWGPALALETRSIPRLFPPVRVESTVPHQIGESWSIVAEETAGLVDLTPGMRAVKLSE